MSEILLDDSAGYVTVRAGDATVTLDLFAVEDRIAELHKAHAADSPGVFAEAVQNYVESLGLPRPNVFGAGQFVREVVRACEDVKKKYAPCPESPASTASTPSAPAP